MLSSKSLQKSVVDGVLDGIVVLLGPDDGISDGGSLGINDSDGALDIEGEALGLNETEGEADRLVESLIFEGVGSCDIDVEADVDGVPDGIVVLLGPDDGISDGGSLGIIDSDGALDIEGEALGLSLLCSHGTLHSTGQFVCTAPILHLRMGLILFAHLQVFIPVPSVPST